MNADVSDIVEMLIELLFLGFGVWGTILLVKEKSRAYTLLAAAAVALGLLLGVSGIIHTGAVIGAALKNKKPYDFRLVSLIATGLILVYFGSQCTKGGPWQDGSRAHSSLCIWDSWPQPWCWSRDYSAWRWNCASESGPGAESAPRSRRSWTFSFTAQ